MRIKIKKIAMEKPSYHRFCVGIFFFIIYFSSIHYRVSSALFSLTPCHTNVGVKDFKINLVGVSKSNYRQPRLCRGERYEHSDKVASGTMVGI